MWFFLDLFRMLLFLNFISINAITIIIAEKIRIGYYFFIYSAYNYNVTRLYIVYNTYLYFVFPEVFRRYVVVPGRLVFRSWHFIFGFSRRILRSSRSILLTLTSGNQNPSSRFSLNTSRFGLQFLLYVYISIRLFIILFAIRL